MALQNIGENYLRTINSVKIRVNPENSDYNRKFRNNLWYNQNYKFFQVF